MARHVVRTRAEGAEKTETVRDGVAADLAAMPGGATGVPDDPNMRSTVIHGIDDIAPAKPELDEDRKRLPRQFRVTGGPAEVLYDGGRVRMIPGKVYTENSVDLDLLRRQGVQLQEVTETT
jgi:hypothetical protein